jgi:hypothetical protein
MAFWLSSVYGFFILNFVEDIFGMSKKTQKEYAAWISSQHMGEVFSQKNFLCRVCLKR